MTSTVPTQFWAEIDGGRVECQLCPRYCKLSEGQRGLCFVRTNQGGQVVMTSYGRSSGFCIDPIEKKPLNHFLPGTAVLSLGTAGCNLACNFCQNHDISKSRSFDTLQAEASPAAIVRAAVFHQCASVAFTYNDPVIFHEYASDVADACHEVGLKTVAVTAGYITDKARPAFFRYIDAANVDLKAFSEDFYWRVTKSHLATVLDTLVYLKRETNIWFEITNLLIPDENDSDREIHAMCEWIASTLGQDVPLHFSAFHPDYKMLDKARTPYETLVRAQRIARQYQLQYVYIGNVQDQGRQSTYCSCCGSRVVGRCGYQLDLWHLNKNGQCLDCGTPLAGVFRAQPGDWGSKRLSVNMSAFA
jgi:pyruvate formate lyase activating enzyme